MNLTREQSILLGTALSRPGLIIATAADSPNDIVWVDLVEKGVLEIVELDDPKEPDFGKFAKSADLRGYRATQRAIDFGVKLQKVSDSEAEDIKLVRLA